MTIAPWRDGTIEVKQLSQRTHLSIMWLNVTKCMWTYRHIIWPNNWQCENMCMMSLRIIVFILLVCIYGSACVYYVLFNQKRKLRCMVMGVRPSVICLRHSESLLLYQAHLLVVTEYQLLLLFFFESYISWNFRGNNLRQHSENTAVYQ